MTKSIKHNPVVTELNQHAQDRIFHSQAILDSIFENSPISMWISDEFGTLITMNDTCRKSMQLKDEEVIGKYNIFQDKILESQGHMQIIREVFEEKRIARFVFSFDTRGIKRLLRTKGKTVTLEVCISPIMNEQGKVTNAIIQHIDISENTETSDALKLSEEKFKGLINSLEIGVLLQGPNAEILVSNPKAIELLGISEDQLLGKTSFDPDWKVIHDDGTDFPGTAHPVPTAIATKKPVKDVIMGVYRPITKDCVWLMVNAEPTLNEEGKIQQVVCTFIDITIRKQLKEALIKAERFSRSVVDSLSVEISILDAKGSIIAVNNEWRKFSIANSLDSSKLCEGANYLSVCDATIGSEIGYSTAMSDGIKLVMNGHQDKFSLEYPCDSPSEKRWFNAIVTRFEDDGNKLITIEHENITVRKTVELALEVNRRELALTKITADAISELAENIINTVREPLIVLNNQLRVVKASRSFYHFFMVTPEETIGKIIYDLGNNQWDIPELRDLLEKILPEQTRFENYEVKHDFSSIGERVMLLNAREIRGGLAQDKIILLAIEDVTEQKQAEREVHLLNAELRELSSHLLSVGEEERSAIAKEIHDELAQNLVALTMNAAYLKSKLKNLSSGNKEIIDEQINIADALIKTSRTLFNSLHPAMLDELGLEDAIWWYAKSKLKSTNIHLDIQSNIKEERLTKEISLVLFRIFQECLTNVLLHSKASEVSIDINIDERSVIMEIQDNGVGFDISKVDTKLQHGLLGLRERVFTMNGAFRNSSIIGKGTTVKVMVPISV